MTDAKPLLVGMWWTLTPAAKLFVVDMCKWGATIDLAMACLDAQIDLGIVTEQEVYQIDSNDEV